ncbi:hypothetical protein FL857_06000 [Criibacterium bergeronii]|uniref:Phage terminase large subunit n=1 Tax=Criibacterium bergeronii TaxID=1871336 RepID=A0A552V713_9FIRM|nr:phage terminase large subunit [Criibacterium bergeronii]TRW26238.1 hypothetical protein FL857_06000 [Criibacterium bergeronii]
MKSCIKQSSKNILKSLIELANENIGDLKSEYDENLVSLTKDYLYSNDDKRKISLQRLYEGGLDIKGKDGIRKRLAAIDLEYFARAYFPHYFSRESASFHKELDHIWSDGVMKDLNVYSKEAAKKIYTLPGNKRAVAAPRGHAKSTNLTFKDTLHSILYAYKHFILIISDVYDQATGFLESIKTELEENEHIKEDFGDITGRIWKQDVVLTSTGIKIVARGSNQKVRGIKHKQYRPDLIICDDIENDELVRTVEQRRKLEDWYFKALSKAGDTYTDIVYVGTVLHYDSLLSKLLKNTGYKSQKYKAVISFAVNSQLWDKWEQIYVDLDDEDRQEHARRYFSDNKDAMLEGADVLWEEKLSYYDLMKMRVDEGESSFNSELQNEPINPDDCLFNEEWFDYYNPFETNFSDGFEFFGFVDPSLGKSKKSDFSAIITIAKQISTGYMYVEDADVQRRHPDKIINDILEKAVRLKKQYNSSYKIFGAETNQFQWFLKEQLAKEAAKRNIYLPIEEVSQSSDKIMRIQTLQPDIKNKYIKFNKNHKKLLEQLKYFPMADHDDAPDALEACRSLASKYKKKLRLLDKRLFGL